MCCTKDGSAKTAVMTMRDDTKSNPVIELSTVYFYEGATPRSIALKDCGLLMRAPVEGVFFALYGYQSKQDGFMAAREFAEKNRLQFTVIDFLVKLDKKINSVQMKPGDLTQHDFITFQRLSRSMQNELHDILIKDRSARINKDEGLDAENPHVLLLENPKLIADAANHPDLQHFKVIVHQAKPLMSERILSVGVVPFRHWDAIQEATCRLNPTTHITLERPEQHEHLTQSNVPTPVKKSKPASSHPR
jgi:hypothetical protein